MRRIRQLAVIMLPIMVLAYCGKGIREVGPADAKKKIMIATLSSEYKDRVARGLEERYRESCRVSMVPIEKIDSVEYKKYDALVIVDALLAWQMFNARTRWFIGRVKEPEEKKKIVLFFTAGKPKNPYSVMGVDCVTGASEMSAEAEAVRKLSERIDAILNR